MKLFALLLCLALPLPALSVKVVEVDHRNESITVRLPMHSTEIEACLMPDEPEIRVRELEYYKVQIKPGKIGTNRPSVLQIKIPDQRPVKFRILNITFLEGSGL